MESVPQIRSFRWLDLDRFTDLFNELNEISDTEKANDAELMRQILSQPSCKPEQDCFVAESAGSLVGFALIAPELRIGRAVASGGVLKPYRNRGLGRRLVKRSVEHAAELGASVLHVSIPATGESGHHILETEGFHQVRRYWQMRWETGDVPALSVAPHAAQ